jgi:hypothetical protein
MSATRSARFPDLLRSTRHLGDTAATLRPEHSGKSLRGVSSLVPVCGTHVLSGGDLDEAVSTSGCFSCQAAS